MNGTAGTSGIIKHKTNVQKVIQRVKQHDFSFTNIQDKRISELLKAKYLRKFVRIHGKMRAIDVEEIASLE